MKKIIFIFLFVGCSGGETTYKNTDSRTYKVYPGYFFKAFEAEGRWCIAENNTGIWCEKIDHSINPPKGPE